MSKSQLPWDIFYVSAFPLGELFLLSLKILNATFGNSPPNIDRSLTCQGECIGNKSHPDDNDDL